MLPFFKTLKDAALARLRHFEFLEGAGPFTFKEGWEGILPGLGDDRLFLDTYEEAMLRERLAHYGITEGLKRLGFDTIRLSLNTADPYFQHLEVFSDEPACADPLAEVTLHRGNFATRAPFAAQLHGLVLPMLFIQWIRLQNPRVTVFPADRPQMPGQKHPGLGLGKKVIVMLSELGKKLKTDGLANTPEYPHNAVLYSREFLYLNPEAEGRLKALKRDLSRHGLADASWGIVLGCVRDERSGMPLEWFKEEQIMPLGGVLKEYFSAPAYREAVKAAAEAVHYVLDVERLKAAPRELPGKG